MQVDEIVNVHEAKTHFSRLLREVQDGRRIAIARNGDPIAVLSSIEDESVSIVERRLGALAGRVLMSSDFDDPMSEFAEYTASAPVSASEAAPTPTPGPESEQE